MSRRVSNGAGSMAFPVIGILVLIASWVVMTDWQSMPAIINNALAAVPWPV